MPAVMTDRCHTAAIEMLTYQAQTGLMQQLLQQVNHTSLCLLQSRSTTPAVCCICCAQGQLLIFRLHAIVVPVSQLLHKGQLVQALRACHSTASRMELPLTSCWEDNLCSPVLAGATTFAARLRSMPVSCNCSLMQSRLLHRQRCCRLFNVKIWQLQYTFQHSSVVISLMVVDCYCFASWFTFAVKCSSCCPKHSAPLEHCICSMGERCSTPWQPNQRNLLCLLTFCTSQVPDQLTQADQLMSACLTVWQAQTAVATFQHYALSMHVTICWGTLQYVSRAGCHAQQQHRSDLAQGPAGTSQVPLIPCGAPSSVAAKTSKHRIVSERPNCLVSFSSKEQCKGSSSPCKDLARPGEL